MLYGTTGKILRVDLTAGSWEIETLSEEFYRMYPGGKALALLHRTPPADLHFHRHRYDSLTGRPLRCPAMHPEGLSGESPGDTRADRCRALRLSGL